MLTYTPVSETQTSVNDGEFQSIFDNEFLKIFWFITNLCPDSNELTIPFLKKVFSYLEVRKFEGDFVIVNTAPGLNEQCDFINENQAEMCKKNLLVLLKSNY